MRKIHLRQKSRETCRNYNPDGFLTWGNSSKATQNPLRTLLNKAARITVSAPFGNIDLRPANDYLGISDVSKLYMSETAKYHFKFVNDLLQTQTGNYFTNSGQMDKASDSQSEPSRGH